MPGTYPPSGGGAITSADMVDPYVPVDGTMNVTGQVVASNHISASGADFKADTGRGLLNNGSGARVLTTADGSGSVRLSGPFANGASAVAVRVEALEDLTTAGAKILSIGDNAGTSYAEKAFVDKDGLIGFGVLTDSTRPAAGTAGRVFFNSDDGNLNIDDGTNWILPDGTTT